MQPQNGTSECSLSSRLLRAVLHISRHLRTRRGADSLSPSALLVLGIIHRRGVVTASAMARELGIRKQSLTTLLQLLEKKECVRREQSGDDARKIVLSLTTTGERAFLADMRQRKLRLEQHMATALTPGECEALNGLLPLLEKLAHAGDDTGEAF